MAVLPAAAAAAYRAAAQIRSPATDAAAGSAPTAGNFSDFLTDAVKSSIDTMKQGETMAASQAAGKADLIDVVTAVNAAEVSLDAVVAVRDKVISAYETIMSMSI